MSSRNSILAALRENQPELSVLPSLAGPISVEADPVEKFKTLATAIGSKIFEVITFDQIKEVIMKQFPAPARIISSFEELAAIAETDIKVINPHLLEDTELAVLKAQLGVAENGSLWVPELNMMQRVLPFICQHLALVVYKKDIVSNMHEAYQVLGNSNTGFGAFIAGPSKTADIEQSLVLGAHGPRSMTVFIMS
ncbi:putative L-lactate dehydrogenase [Arcticibacter svalbardensis MN12-7]|uniref:Putative L-lactate dehydrogenase n=1 Tax=Arcticibacter svalbardensis MN12-7 TaxID=1150600 RepID=R9GTY7_9SPHI|nr:LUD domain-containing protein [Arcticibacter svalbardensis]EOR95138.1 putative L-lactate dehydrogenase [Arcticibacter svalbardensis MN12-7]